jgi:formylglycine-generating enzyme required for sulfatase activity
MLVTACGSNGKPTDGEGGSSATSAGGSATTAGTGATGGFNCTETADPGDTVDVPAGDFDMGCNDAVDKNCSDDEKPLHTVSLSQFAIDRTEVTQAQFTACIIEGACTVPTCDWNCDNTTFPAGCVTWAQASAYCSWAGRRLPTEAEWEKAARGEEGGKYPWGNTEPDCNVTNMAGCGDAAVAVGSFPAGASPYGALDMAGNMVELVADRYGEDYYAASPATDPQGPGSGSRYSGRGGGFKSEPQFLRASKRDWYDPTDAGLSLGFRCAR